MSERNTWFPDFPDNDQSSEIEKNGWELKISQVKYEGSRRSVWLFPFSVILSFRHPVRSTRYCVSANLTVRR